MGIRKSSVKNKKSQAATARNAVQRQEARRLVARTREEGQQRPPTR